MKRSTDRILTTHAGRLTGSSDVMAARTAVQTGSAADWETFKADVRTAMTDVIRRQAGAGIDVVSDGELGKFNGIAYYGQRMTGLSSRPPGEGEVVSRNLHTNERLEFDEFYSDLGRGQRPADRMVCTGPISYKGHDNVKSDIEIFKASLKEANVPQRPSCACWRRAGSSTTCSTSTTRRMRSSSSRSPAR